MTTGSAWNWAHGMFCQNVYGTQVQNFSLKCCLLTGLRASENFDCYPKMGTQQKLFIFKGAPETKFYSLVCFKS